VDFGKDLKVLLKFYNRNFYFLVYSTTFAALFFNHNKGLQIEKL
tara:strand:- start:15995 stop:16126 length:132 start_codon:yes stop_codon:yes gene_type:complete